MAFATMDPKKAEALRAAAEREIADIAAREAVEREIQEQTKNCYREYVPCQLRNAGKMLKNHTDGAARVRQAEDAGINCWERIGRSRGGRRKGNLYLCMVRR